MITSGTAANIAFEAVETHRRTAGITMREAVTMVAAGYGQSIDAPISDYAQIRALDGNLRALANWIQEQAKC